jgi:carbon-monoxide dehydrogenase small subunit
VLIDGQPTLSCLVLPIEVQGSEFITVEGIAANGQPHELQIAFAELGAAQCGYCTPGMLISAKSLLDADAHPDGPAIREALAGNLCRCTGYNKIIEAVELAAERMRSERPQAELANPSGNSNDR